MITNSLNIKTQNLYNMNLFLPINQEDIMTIGRTRTISPFKGTYGSTRYVFDLSEIPEEDKFEAMLGKAIEKTKNLTLHGDITSVVDYWIECYQLAPQDRKKDICEVFLNYIPDESRTSNEVNYIFSLVN